VLRPAQLKANVMVDPWPWLAIAGLGALHGSSPANGWMFAAASGLRARDPTRAHQALAPIAVGHAASVALVAAVVALGGWLDHARVGMAAGALLIAAAVHRLLHGARRRNTIDAPCAGRAAIALWSFVMATAHGAGLMLVPALVPLCLSDTPAREITASGSLLLALGAVAVHTATMLATSGLIASGVCRGLSRRPALLHGALLQHAWTVALALSGLGLMVPRIGAYG
jgi:hypothetical protein